jgi:Flp pilus assembly protein TadG
MGAAFRLRADARGSAAVEFALIVPFMLAVAMGSFELFKLTQATLRANFVAQSVADLVSRDTSLTSTTMSDICTGGQLLMAPLPTSGLKIAVANVSRSGSTRSRTWNMECYGATAISSSDAISLATNETPSDGTSAVVVRITYSYQAPKSYLLPASRTVTAEFVAKPRSGSS